MDIIGGSGWTFCMDIDQENVVVRGFILPSTSPDFSCTYIISAPTNSLNSLIDGVKLPFLRILHRSIAKSILNIPR